jgi:signal transduction histidine kinase
LDERGARWLALIEQNGRELVARVEGLLAVARVGARQEGVAAVDPGLVIGQVLKARAWELERRRARIDVAQDFPLVACHQAYLRQVFDNIISNAVKFTPEETPPDIAITAVRQGHMVCFAVRDRGIGIPPDKRDRVFEPFVRLQAEGVKGSGIGLTIVKRIVELYGGKVWIESNEGPGSTVKFTLPVLGELESVVPDSVLSVEERRRPGD